MAWLRGFLTPAGCAVMFIAACMVGPPAAADPAPSLADAVNAVRGSACGALRYDPQVEQGAEIVNRSTYDYLNHTAENVPLDDPHPISLINDLGVDATKVIALKGASQSEVDSIKGLLIQGYKDIPDCTYTDYGVSMLREPETGYTITVALLVGP